MARWKPSTVEEIQDWLAGRYVPNPTDEEYDRWFWERVRLWVPRVRRKQQ